MDGLHNSVLTEASIAYMNCRTDGIYDDATAGNGGHSMRLLQTCPSIGRLIAIDCDAEAVERTRAKLSGYAGQEVLIGFDLLLVLGTLGPCIVMGGQSPYLDILYK